MEFNHTIAGISDTANSIPKIYQTEMTHKEWFGIRRNKVVPNTPASLTSNADWWVSALGETFTVNNGTWVFNRQTPQGVATTILFFNEDGSLQKASVFAPALFEMFKAKYGDVEAAKVASSIYHFRQVEEANQMTSIAAVCTLSEGAIVNNSFVDLMPWKEHPSLSPTHAYVLNVLNCNNGDQTTALRLRFFSIIGSTDYNLTIYGQHFSGEPKPIALQTLVPNHYVDSTTIEFDESVTEAIYDAETNTVFVNPILDKCQAFGEVMPSDQFNKRETDNSPVIDLRTGDRIGNW